MMQQTRLRIRTHRPLFKTKLFWNKITLDKTDLRAIGILLIAVAYMGITQPMALVFSALLGAFAFALHLLNESIHKAVGFGLPVKGWHLASIVIALTLVLSQFHAPADAAMFKKLEETVTQAIAGSGGAIDAAIITSIFNVFRVMIVFAFIIGGIVVLTQAFRGGDWQPIANLIGIGVAFVIGVEVISALVIA